MNVKDVLKTCKFFNPNTLKLDVYEEIPDAELFDSGVRKYNDKGECFILKLAGEEELTEEARECFFERMKCATVEQIKEEWLETTLDGYSLSVEAIGDKLAENLESIKGVFDD